MHTVSLNSIARMASAEWSLFSAEISSPPASLSWSDVAVSSTSEDVMPAWMYRASEPTCSATSVRNAITSCWTVPSISSIRRGSNAALDRMISIASAGMTPRRVWTSHTASSTSSHFR
jgi:hypothetical protein